MSFIALKSTHRVFLINETINDVSAKKIKTVRMGIDISLQRSFGFEISNVSLSVRIRAPFYFRRHRCFARGITNVRDTRSQTHSQLENTVTCTPLNKLSRKRVLRLSLAKVPEHQNAPSSATTNTKTLHLNQKMQHSVLFSFLFFFLFRFLKI